MYWEFVAVLMTAIPVILLLAILIWYLNTRGVYAAIRKAIAGRVALKKVRESLLRKDPLKRD